VTAASLPALGGGTGRGARLPRGAALVALVTVGAAGLLLLTQNPLVALAPMVLVVAAWTVLHAPLRHTLYALLALVVFADIVPRDPHDAEGVAMWHSIATPLQRLLLDNLNKLTGVEALRVSGVELLIAGLLVLAAARVLSGQGVDRAGRTAAAWPMYVALGVSLGTVLAMELWGAARGGDVRQSLWQFRQLLWMPPLAALLCYALRGPRDLGTLLGVLTATSCAKIAVGLYYYVVARRILGEKPATVTSHADTVLFVVVLAVWAAAALERPTMGRLAMAAGVWGWTLLGMVINNRRTAFVSLAACLYVLFWRLRPAQRRGIVRAAMLAMPLILGYFAIGRYKTTGIFAPAASVWSVTRQKDGSSITRDIENFNLIVTLHAHPLVGSGWGHEYVEQVKADDISKFFPQYRYIAHNSVLWLWSIGGLAGFALLWWPLVTGVFLATRAHWLARTSAERTGAYAALAVFTTYVIQAWADMGTESWTTNGLLACAVAIAAKLATTTGAWPSSTSLTPHATESLA